MSSLIELDDSRCQHRGQLVLRLQRADRRNALTRQMLRDLLAALDTIASRSDVRVLVLESSGPVFCAGMDLGEMQSHANSPDKEQQWQIDSELYAEVVTRLFSLPFPTIAQVQGPVLAGGVGLVVACDFVVCASTAYFALPEPVRGITAAIVTPFLVFRVGAGLAGQWLLSGQRVTAEQAQRSGFCRVVIEPETIADHVEQLTTTILSGAPTALAITKRHWHQCTKANEVIQQAQASIQVSAEARQSADAREGLAAFLEKRPPSWTVE
ncbi:MAG: enoyl-CoA hydratase/isomerase family protein [Planctomycetaceae bacterium]|nr:enoyl-CoA hydratase/isomerase family protein [Planctomycetaceae bacterium]